MNKERKIVGNKLKQNISPLSTSTQFDESTYDKAQEGLVIGNKKLQLQKEREAREEEEQRRALEEKAKEVKSNASKKKANKKSTKRAKQQEEPKEEQIVQKPKTHIKRNPNRDCDTSKEFVIDKSKEKYASDYSEVYNSEAGHYQESTARRNSLKLNRNTSNENFCDEYQNTSTKAGWGKRKDSYQSPKTWNDPENQNIGLGFELECNNSIKSNYDQYDSTASNSEKQSETEQKTDYNRTDNRNEPFFQDNKRNSNTNYRSQNNFSKYPNRNLNIAKGDYNRQNYGDLYRNDGRDDRNFQYFMESTKHRPEINHGKLTEVKGDLFTASKDFALAHCVAEDMSMGAGIAKTFRTKFGEVGKLLSQNQQTGGVAVLQKETRFIYYLVTKYQSRGKPTYYTLWQSLYKLKEHIQENNVTKLALPQIGCGLDRLEWYVVRQMLEYIFKDVDIKIDYYVYDESVDESLPKKVLKKCVVVHEIMNLLDIRGGTGLLYFGTADGCETEEIKCIASKFNLQAYKAPHNVTDIVRSTPSNDYYIYGLIIKKFIDDEINYFDIEKSIRNLRKILEKDHTNYIGLQAFIDKKDKLLMDKIIALMQYIFIEIEIWVCWPQNLQDHCPQQKKTFF